MPQNMSVAENRDYEIGRLYDLPIEAISPNPDQPRRTFEPAPMEALKRSIEREGLLQPIAVLPGGDGRFLIAAGERRYRAFCELGRSTIPACIVSGDVEDLAIVENIVREDLNPMERAMAMQTFLQKHRMTKKALAATLGLAKNSVSEILSLNKLPEEIRSIVLHDKRYPLRGLRVIARTRDAAQQRERFARLKARIDGENASDAETTGRTADFDAAKKRDRILKMTAELKRLYQAVPREKLRKLAPEIEELHEQLEAIRYRISDEIRLRD
ncbi:MAG: ParB/RepB/Spo0J family partition protein [Desulfovibrio sp.]|nr:ParB/RepB/Spo0J family partition protein [Desulfovibrio sp.]